MQRLVHMHNDWGFHCFLMFIIVFFSMKLSRSVCVINDKQQGLESELRMVAPNQQLAMSLASINISFHCEYGCDSTAGEGRSGIVALTREYTRMRSSATLIAAPVHAYDH